MAIYSVEVDCSLLMNRKQRSLGELDFHNHMTETIPPKFYGKGGQPKNRCEKLFSIDFVLNSSILHYRDNYNTCC